MTEPTRSPDNYRDATERARDQCPGMPNAICHACGLGYKCHDPQCPNDAPQPTACWARTWRRAEISIESADAQRDMRDRCVAEVRLQARTLRECGGNSAFAIALDALADVLASLRVRAEPTGLEGRGA